MTDVAITVKATLASITGSKHIYPATFADVGHNLIGHDRGTGKATAVQIDSVGSFANRIESELAATGILPEIVTAVGDREISIHELPHRAYDAILRDSLINDVPWRQSDIGAAVLSSTPRNATNLFKYAPLTLLLGGWDSHGGDAGAGAKIARSVSCEIWGYDVLTSRHCTQRIDPLSITADSEKHSVIDGILQPDDKGKKPSELGHGDVPGSDAKGVFVDNIELSGAISLTRLNRYNFPDESDNISEERDNAARTFLANLALYGIVQVMDHLDLRSGCELYTSERSFNQVSAGGTMKEITPPSLEDLKDMVLKVKAHGLAFADQPVKLTAGPALLKLADKGGI